MLTNLKQLKFMTFVYRYHRYSRLFNSSVKLSRLNTQLNNLNQLKNYTSIVSVGVIESNCTRFSFRFILYDTNCTQNQCGLLHNINVFLRFQQNRT